MHAYARSLVRMAAVAALGFLVFGPAGTATAADVPPHVATIGGDVVIYTHRFKPEEFAKALNLVTDGFTKAQTAAGQTRHNYFLVDEANATVVVVSFFAAGESVEEWHKSMQREDVLKQLAPLRREPLAFERYTVSAVTATE